MVSTGTKPPTGRHLPAIQWLHWWVCADALILVRPHAAVAPTTYHASCTSVCRCEWRCHQAPYGLPFVRSWKFYTVSQFGPR